MNLDPRLRELLEGALSAVSHDVLARLIAVRGFAHLLRKQNPDADAGAHAERLESNAAAAQDALRAGIEYLQLALSGVDAVPIDVGSMIRAVYEEELRDLEASGRPELVMGELEQAIGTADLVRTIVTPLVRGAVRSAGGGRGGGLRVGCVSEGDRHTYSIVDGASVFDLSAIERAFDDPCGPRDRAPPGLAWSGLALARLAAARLGGTLRCESAGETGGVWYLTLPGARAC